MTRSQTYDSGPALMTAITDSAKKASKQTGIPAAAIVTRMLFDRFLCRIFLDVEAQFALKGGTRMLAYLPTARATQDVDLETSAYTLDEAIVRLTQLASRDIGDHITFGLLGVKKGGSADQPNAQIARLTFSVYLSGRVKRGLQIKLDLAVHVRPGAPLVTASPKFRIDLPRPIPVVDYRMIATEDQFADKCAAMMETGHGGDGRSSRAKDLVDLVLIARTENMDAETLHASIRGEIEDRSMPGFTEIDASDSIQRNYSTAASKVTDLERDWKAAEDLVNLVIRPLLDGSVTRGTWGYLEVQWIVEQDHDLAIEPPAT